MLYVDDLCCMGLYDFEVKSYTHGHLRSDRDRFLSKTRSVKLQQVRLERYSKAVFGCLELGSELGNLELRAQFYRLVVLGIRPWN